MCPALRDRLRNTQQGKLLGFDVLFHALYCEEIPLAYKRQHCYKALTFWSFCVKTKGREKTKKKNKDSRILLPAHKNNNI